MPELTKKEIEAQIKQFEDMCDLLKNKVTKAARARYAKGIPALTQQTVSEHYDHMQEHVLNVLAGSRGDEVSVEEQVLHATCRALLANFTFLVNNGNFEEK